MNFYKIKPYDPLLKIQIIKQIREKLFINLREAKLISEGLIFTLKGLNKPDPKFNFFNFFERTEKPTDQYLLIDYWPTAHLIKPEDEQKL